MTGIKDVAREVGVSTATVSRALRGLPRVSPDTRERVLEVATRMGYVASPHAASLASGQTHAIGVVVPNVTRWFFGSVVHGAEELLREEGYDLLLYTVTGEPAARQRLFSTYLLSKRVDAVMVLALRPTPEEVASLDRTGSPTVAVGGAVPGWSSVRIDDVETAATAVRHLVGLGHRRIAHLGGVPDPEHAGLDFSTPGDRLIGYRLAMEEAGLQIEEGWEVTGDFTAHGGLTACRRLLSARRPPDRDLRRLRRDGHRRLPRRPRGRPPRPRGHLHHRHRQPRALGVLRPQHHGPTRPRARPPRRPDDSSTPSPRMTPWSQTETIVPTQLIVRGTTARVG